MNTLVLIETALFNNCLLLESMDITKCLAMAHLKIYAQNRNKFKVIRVGDCAFISRISIDAPTLRLFHYCGHTFIFKFVHVLQLNDMIIVTHTYTQTLFSETFDRKFKKPQSCFWHLKGIPVVRGSKIFAMFMSYDIALEERISSM